MFAAYRIAYFTIAALFLFNILGTQYVGTVPAAIAVLKIASELVLCGNLALVVAFQRVHTPVFWIAVFIWQVLFAWYGWLSPGAPFIELLRGGALAGILFALLSAWFDSLPIVRTRYQRTRGRGVGPEKGSETH